MIWLRYVPHSEVADYLARGWEISNSMQDCHHGAHSVLMVWKGEGEPR